MSNSEKPTKKLRILPIDTEAADDQPFDKLLNTSCGGLEETDVTNSYAFGTEIELLNLKVEEKDEIGSNESLNELEVKRMELDKGTYEFKDEEYECNNENDNSIHEDDDNGVALYNENDDDDLYLEEHIKWRMGMKYDALNAGQLESTRDDALKQASIVLDVVSWLCDGQNRDMQETLRQQGFAFSNNNIVAEVAVILQTLAEHISFKNMPIIKKAIQALIEMCAGNYVNQETALKGQIIDSINTILQCCFKKPSEEELEQILKVKASTTELLEVMLEETHQDSYILAQGISDDLSVPTLLQVMLEITEIGSNINHLKTTTERAVFRGYHVLKKIADYLNITVDNYVLTKDPKFLKSSKAALSMWQHLGKWSRSIEVNYITKDNKEILTKVYFSFDPSKELSEADKNTVHNKINRESPDDKVKDLLNWMESIKNNKRHEAYVESQNWLKWTIYLSDVRHIALMFLTLLLNLIVLFLFEVPHNLRVSEIETGNVSDLSVSFIRNPITPEWFSHYVLYFLGIIHLFLSLWMVIEYFVVKAKNFLFSVPFFGTILWSLRKKLLKNVAAKNILTLLNRHIFKDHIAVTPPKKANCFEINVLSFGPLYRLFFLLCSLLALAFRGYFYCGCVLYLFINSAVLKQVLEALGRSALQLIVVGLLGAAIIFIYAVMSFAFLHEFFNPKSSLFCNSLWQCFVTVSREGLLDTLGSALPVMNDQEDASFTIYAVRTIFDLSFFIIITTLGLNIVIAILVDRFSELRSEKDEVKKDKLNYCFICGIDSDTFETKAKGFRHHVKNDHSKWDYIYFVLHLDSVYKNDYNALEKYIYDYIEEKKIGFFPLRKAKILKDPK